MSSYNVVYSKGKKMYHNNLSCWCPVKPTPSKEDFVINVISKHPDFDNLAMKKYVLDGINTIGVFGSEAFEIHFQNNSYEDVQTRISLDGIDCLTGKLADLELNHNMWFVRAGRTLHLKAWAENNNGGARFVFTDADKSVALHSHGDVSHKGIISAAVFTEKERPRALGERLYAIGGPAASSGGVLSAGLFGVRKKYGSKEKSSETLSEISESFDLKREEASVGAGEYVEQKTKTVKGLDEPVLNSIIRVRYVWYDHLASMVKTSSVKRIEDWFPTGFPAEKIKTFADISNVPRVKSSAAEKEESIPRFV